MMEPEINYLEEINMMEMSWYVHDSDGDRTKAFSVRMNMETADLFAHCFKRKVIKARRREAHNLKKEAQRLLNERLKNENNS